MGGGEGRGGGGGGGGGGRGGGGAAAAGGHGKQHDRGKYKCENFFHFCHKSFLLIFDTFIIY